MIRPDLRIIMENMLMSEGFMRARQLSIKFFELYDLSGELLSKQRHYDWGLRAVKSVLRCAGTYKRDSPDLDEEPVLMRALVRRRIMCDTASYYTRYIPVIHLYYNMYTPI